MKIVFIKDYSYTKKKDVSCYPPMVGCAFEDINYNWKKGDVVESIGGVGGTFSQDKKIFNLGQGNWSVPVPFDTINIIVEDSNKSFLQKHKNHLLILGALVLGYLAYKKINK